MLVDRNCSQPSWLFISLGHADTDANCAMGGILLCEWLLITVSLLPEYYLHSALPDSCAHYAVREESSEYYELIRVAL